MTVSLRALDEGTGILVDDRIERRQCRLYTASAVEPVAVDDDRIDYPVDNAVSVRTSEVTLSQQSSTFVRDTDGQIVAEVEHFTEQQFDAGSYTVDLSGPVKLFLQVEGPLTVSADAVQVTVSLDAAREIVVGARSYHEHPAATVTTTDDPRDVMEAVSYLGSALKTTAPERSYPTTRGHPPALEVGDALSIPEELDRPDTGTRIEVPPALDEVFVVAPLAYYLGATVEPGPVARIVTDTGFEHTLDGPDGVEAEAERVLKQTFLLDCVARKDNADAITLYEREAIESVTDLDFAGLYEQSPAERLETYLGVPFGLVEDHVPKWKLTAHVAPTPDSIEILPFLVDDLAVIQIPDASPVSRSEAQSAAIGEFSRGDFVRSPSGGADMRSATNAAATPSLVQPERTDSIEQVWVGENVPVGASKAVVEAYWNRLAREGANDDVEIVVVCNDAEMLDERDTAGEVYGSRDELPFDVTLYDDLTTDRLRLVLESDVDFLHYIGHIDDTGFECPDGIVDVADLDDVGVDAFFLNACQSYAQGLELIRRGAIGGVVTLDDVINSGAVRVGKTMTRLLNAGFPLRAALGIAKDRSIVGGQYLVVGDGNVDLAHAESMAPLLSKSLQAYATDHLKLGGIIRPEIAANHRFFLVPGETVDFEVTADELLKFLQMEQMPVKFDGEFVWSNRVSADAF